MQQTRLKILNNKITQYKTKQNKTKKPKKKKNHILTYFVIFQEREFFMV